MTPAVPGIDSRTTAAMVFGPSKEMVRSRCSSARAHSCSWVSA